MSVLKSQVLAVTLSGNNIFHLLQIVIAVPNIPVISLKKEYIYTHRMSCT